MDFYILLGIERGATLTDIKRAYKRLARKHHPDINPGDRTAAVQFRQIAEAYETLSDPDRRRRYDTAGGAAAVEPATFGFEGFDFSVSVSGASAPTFGDLFADVFHQRERQREAMSAVRGADLHHTVTLAFEDAMTGGQRPIVVTRQEHCPDCGGKGHPASAESRCRHCGGGGVVTSARGHMVFSKACPQCKGTGQHVQSRCGACSGGGLVTRSEPLVVQVPPGMADGARLRIPGHGHAAAQGGEPGDLYITLRVEPHPFFRREGDDLHVVVPIAIHEAALGAKVEVPSIEGRARLRVPPGTQSGQRFRLRERGVVSTTSGRRGDLVVEARLVLPRMLDERSKELLREFGRLNAGDVREPLQRGRADGVDGR